MAFRRKGLGEVSGSVSMLLVMMALLAGASAVSIVSVRGAASLVSGTANKEARSIGQLVEVVLTQVNSSGSYIWLFNYGWVDSQITAVYLNGVKVPWNSCGTIVHGFLCTIALPVGTKGTVTAILGDRSLEVVL